MCLVVFPVNSNEERETKEDSINARKINIIKAKERMKHIEIIQIKYRLNVDV